MKTYVNPNPKTWCQIIQRPLINQEQLTEQVSTILQNVKHHGDSALMDYTLQFDKVKLKSLTISNSVIEQSGQYITPKLKNAINIAFDNILKFHQAQKEPQRIIEGTKGVQCWRESVAIEKVGLYIPGGSAPLFSTILMLGIPAKIAGCKEIVLCTPPSNNDTINPVILYTANRVGIRKIYTIGGAQAIAAMAYGTESVPKVYKIFGPGNQYVTQAKSLVQQSGVAIDMPAGPSEVLIIADKTCNPKFVAADLLSQAEHGVDSQVILLSNDASIVEKCLQEVAQQKSKLPRNEIVTQSLTNSKAIVLEDLEECISLSNIYAPEHLIIASEKAHQLAEGITNAGSVFLGNYSCESAGDYASGTNHTLPTNGFARNYSGVSLDSFVKKITYQYLTKEGISNIGQAIEIMAEAEQLIAHKNAVSVRLKEIQNG